MLGETTAYPTIAVKDINTAKEFYGVTLGLKVLDDQPWGVTYQSGSSSVYIYPSQYAGTNQATYVSWRVTNVEDVVADLKGKGVVFEHYDDLPETTREGDVHIMGPMKFVWFKDPDGNILSFGTM